MYAHIGLYIILPYAESEIGHTKITLLPHVTTKCDFRRFATDEDEAVNGNTPRHTYRKEKHQKITYKKCFYM